MLLQIAAGPVSDYYQHCNWLYFKDVEKNNCWIKLDVKIKIIFRQWQNYN